MIETKIRFSEAPDSYKVSMVADVLRGQIEGVQQSELDNMLKYVVKKINTYSRKKYQVLEIQPEKRSNEIGEINLAAILGSIERRRNNYEPLTDDEFKIIRLLYENNYSQVTIAEIMKISRNTVKKALADDKRYEVIKFMEEEALENMKRRYGLK